MRIRAPKDFWAGLMFIAFGVGFVIVARNYAMGTAVRMGPAYFPVVLGGILAVLGAIIFLRAYVSKITGIAAELKLAFNILDLAVAVGVFVVMTYLAKWLKISNDYAMLGSALVISLLAIVFRPNAKPLALILACSLAFAYLLKPLGLAISAVLLVFIGAFGGHEFKWKEVTILTACLVVFSIVVFVKGLTLPFPICPSFIDNCPIR